MYVIFNQHDMLGSSICFLNLFSNDNVIMNKENKHTSLIITK